MDIQYMKMLQENPELILGGNPIFRNKPINFPNDPMIGIEEMEKEFNDAKPFPKAFREFLFLAGDFCYVHHSDADYREANEFVRESLTDHGFSLGRPFFVFAYGPSEDIFFYLDEGDDDPHLYSLRFPVLTTSQDGIHTFGMEIKPREDTLVKLIEYRIRMQHRRNKLGLRH